MKTQARLDSKTALTLVEMLVVVAALGLVALVLLPSRNFYHCSQKAQRITCVNNLKQIGLSFRIWSGDNGDCYPMRLSVTNGGTMEWTGSGAVRPHFLVMSNELNTPKVLVCPQDTVRVKEANSIFKNLPDLQTRYPSQHWFPTNCPLSYFVGLDAEETQPQMFLSGDSNLELDGKPVSPGLLNLWTNSAVGWNKPRHGKFGNICFADGSVQQVNSAQLREALTRTGVATNRLAMP